MAESHALRDDEHGRLTGDADANGYRRPLPDRGSEAGFSTSGGVASANNSRSQHDSSPGRLGRVMDRDVNAGRGRLADWPLAIKTILAFWTFYYLVATTRAFLIEQPGQLEMLPRRAVVIVAAMLISALIILLLQRTERLSVRANLVTAGLAALPASALLAGLNHHMFYVFAPEDAAWVGPKLHDMEDWTLLRIIADSTHHWFFFFASWAGLYVALGYARRLSDADRRAAVLVRQAQEAQLRALRYQINPHFLFNTLNSLSSLVLAEKNDTAERMLMNLSCFFRTTLAADPTADVPLSEEIRLQRLYLEIEQVRFPERLRVEVDVPEELLGQRVPMLILQPLVENSVKYGVARANRPVTVTISAYEEAGRLHLKVRDNGDTCQVRAEEEGAESTGVGLRNVCERLASRFGDTAGCIHGPNPDGGYSAHIYFPGRGNE
ncbi:MAG TPA: histidine kinase [Allosphingosinicella sp.]|nr:histidine kinase [Allosphingosinicella sp.]